MQITVLIEEMNGQGFRASSALPFGVSAEGATREEALAKLKDEVDARIKNGAQLVTIETAGEPNPWLDAAGMYRDDPLFDEWQQAIAEYRDQVDRDDDCL